MATLRELRELKLGAPKKHEIQRLENTGTCGIMPECGVWGARLACMVCRVRICRNMWCLNEHINENRGNRVNEKPELRRSSDQGEKKECPGRARNQQGVRDA